MLIIIRSGKSINNVVMLITIKSGKSINNRRDTHYNQVWLFILLPDLIIMSITTVIYTLNGLDYKEYHDGFW
jgi:hypothetical protein